MRRLVALSRIRAQLSMHQQVLNATIALGQALQQQLPSDMQAGLYTWELRPLLHQVCVVCACVHVCLYVCVGVCMCVCERLAGAWSRIG